MKCIIDRYMILLAVLNRSLLMTDIILLPDFQQEDAKQRYAPGCRASFWTVEDADFH